MAQDITKEEAKEIIEEAEEGFLMVYGLSPKRTIGTVPLNEWEWEVEMKSYRFEEDD